jgi:hypothetical protein
MLPLVLSSDSHVFEQPDLWQTRIDAHGGVARPPQCPAGCRGTGNRRKADERTPVARGGGDCARRRRSFT